MLYLPFSPKLKCKKFRFHSPEIIVHINPRASWQTTLNHQLLSPPFFYNMTPVECFTTSSNIPRHLHVTLRLLKCSVPPQYH